MQCIDTILKHTCTCMHMLNCQQICWHGAHLHPAHLMDTNEMHGAATRYNKYQRLATFSIQCTQNMTMQHLGGQHERVCNNQCMQLTTGRSTAQIHDTPRPLQSSYPITYFNMAKDIGKVNRQDKHSALWTHSQQMLTK